MKVLFDINRHIENNFITQLIDENSNNIEENGYLVGDEEWEVDFAMEIERVVVVIRGNNSVLNLMKRKGKREMDSIVQIQKCEDSIR